MMNRYGWLQSVYLNGVYPYDLRMLLWFVRNRQRRAWVAVARAVSRSGDGLMQVLLPSLMWLLDRDHGLKFFIATALGFALERPLYWLLKNGCQRKRPPEVIPSFNSIITASDRFSFPSGHTCGAFLLAAIGSSFYPVLAAPLYVWASAVGVSRVALGVHFPTDILAGALIGSTIAWFIGDGSIAVVA